MKYPKIAAVSLLVSLSGYAQKPYKFPEKFNAFYDFKPDAAYQTILKDNPEQEKINLDFFAVNYLYREQFDFDFNHVYMDWVEVENYFIKVLHGVLPPGSQKRDLKFFFERSVVENAHVSRIGNIYLNLGMFCVAENEAFLAGVLAHEAGHFYFDHNITSQKEFADMKQYVGFGSPKFIADRKESYLRYYKMKRMLEYQADTFAMACLEKAGVNYSTFMNYQEEEDIRQHISQHSRSYKNMLSASAVRDTLPREQKSHTLTADTTQISVMGQFDLAQQLEQTAADQGKLFYVDSVFFWKLKHLARDERKRICMEGALYDECAFFAVVDYMQEPKNLKNLYYLMESVRRRLIIRPELSGKGFLSDMVNDDYLYYHNKSIFHRPEYILNSVTLYTTLATHPFVDPEKRPFETYEQAFLYFAREGQRLNFNEANMSLALYYQTKGQRDSATHYLTRYVNNGNGLYKDMAVSMLKHGAPRLSKGKNFILYNTIGHYTGITYNYYLAKRHQQTYNPAIREVFGKDSLRTDLVFMNELMGSSPNRLQDMKKLANAVVSLYSEDDIQLYKKIRIRSNYAGEDNPAASSSSKHLFLYAPEWYNWFSEQGYDKLFFVDAVYQYPAFDSKAESFNTYTAYYLDVNLKRPYFRDASRAGANYKQKEKDIHEDLRRFLYE